MRPRPATTNADDAPHARTRADPRPGRPTPLPLLGRTPCTRPSAHSVGSPPQAQRLEHGQAEGGQAPRPHRPRTAGGLAADHRNALGACWWVVVPRHCRRRDQHRPARPGVAQAFPHLVPRRLQRRGRPLRLRLGPACRRRLPPRRVGHRERRRPRPRRSPSVVPLGQRAEPLQRGQRPALVMRPRPGPGPNVPPQVYPAKRPDAAALLDRVDHRICLGPVHDPEARRVRTARFLRPVGRSCRRPDQAPPAAAGKPPR